jgi:hypothetical protein
MKKVIYGLFALLIIVYFYFLINVDEKPFEEKSFEYVNKIIIEFLPPNDRIVIEDKQQIKKIINYLETLSLRQEKPKHEDGSSYRIYIDSENNYLCSISSNQLFTKSKIYRFNHKMFEKFETLINYNN